MQPSDITTLVENFLKGTDKFLVDVLVKPGNRVYVFIDGDHSVTIDDCVRISRMLESNLDREEEDFELNVSSAGADQPLRMPRQYPKNIGRSLQIRLEEDKVITGKLEKVEEEGIWIVVDGDKKKKTAPMDHYIAFQTIKEAKVIISFK